MIYLINLVGAIFNFHIGLNYITAIFTGILGVPGVILLVILRVILGGWKNLRFQFEISSFYFYSTVTDLARFLGLSTSNPFSFEM